jgi:hypothetical protein
VRVQGGARGHGARAARRRRRRSAGGAPRSEGCEHKTHTERGAREHANKNHLGVVMPPDWVAATKAIRCNDCTRYFAAHTGPAAGQMRYHACNKVLPNHRGAKLDRYVLTIPDGTFVIEECGATLFRGGEVLVARCFFLATARAIGATRDVMQARALLMHEETLRLLKTDADVRTRYEPHIISAILSNKACAPGDPAPQKTIDDLIAKFESTGYADDPIISAACYSLGCAIEVWERNANGQIVVNTILPLGPVPAVTVRVWRTNEHYQALVPEALAQRAPPAPTAPTMHTSNRATIKDWEIRVTNLLKLYGEAGSSITERHALALQLLHSPPAAAKRKTATPMAPPDCDFDLDDEPFGPPPLAAPDTFSDAIAAATKELRAGHVSRALSKLFSAGMLPLTVQTQAKLATKYPKGSGMDVDTDVDEVDDADSDADDVVTFTI